MSRPDQHVLRPTKIPQPTEIMQTAFFTPRLRTSNQNVCIQKLFKQPAPSRAIYDSKQLKSACSFLKQLKEKLETDSTTQFEYEGDALLDVISTLSDVNDAITPILSSSSSAFRRFENTSRKEFDDALNAASKVYEVATLIRQEIANSEESMCYFSKQIIASNYDQFNTFKDNLSTIGDRIYVDEELVRQLVDLQVLLKDTILKLKGKQLKNGSELKSLNQSRSWSLDKVKPSTEQEPGTPMLSGNTLLSNEFSLIKHGRGPEEIKIKPENKDFFDSCIEYIDQLKACIQKAVKGGICDQGEVKVYKDRKSRAFDELRVTVYGTPLVIQTPRMSKIDRLSTEEVEGNEQDVTEATKFASAYVGQPYFRNNEEDIVGGVKPVSTYTGRHLFRRNDKDSSDHIEKFTSSENVESLPDVFVDAREDITGSVKPYKGKLPPRRKDKDSPDHKAKFKQSGNSGSSNDQKVRRRSKTFEQGEPEHKIVSNPTTTPYKPQLKSVNGKEKPTSDKAKEKSISMRSQENIHKDAMLATPLKSKEKPTPEVKSKSDKSKDYSLSFKKEKQPGHISKSNDHKRKKDLQQISTKDSKSGVPHTPYTGGKTSFSIADDECVCSSKELDVEKQNSTLRELGINHHDVNVANTLKQIPVDCLLMSCRPAKCCRKTVLNEKSRTKFPYAASLRSLPLVQKDLDKIKELVQSNVHFLDSCTTSESYVHFQKHTSDKLLYFCNAPTSHIEVRFFEFFRREFSITNLAKRSKIKTTQSSYEIRILDFLRRFYNRDPAPQQKEQKRSKKQERKSNPSKQGSRSKNTKKDSVKAMLKPQFSFSSASFISSKFKEKKNKSNYSFLLVPKSKVTSYISEEVSTYKRKQKRDIDASEQKTSTFLEDVKNGLDSPELDVSSLSPANYAETLTAIYQLDEEGNIKAKSKHRPHKIEVTTQHQDDYIELTHKGHFYLHDLENKPGRDQNEITPPLIISSRQTSHNIGNYSKYKVSATSVIGPEVTGNSAIRNGPEKVLKATEPNLCTIYEVEESKRSDASDEIYQQRCHRCQKLMVQNFSDESMMSYSHHSRTSASESAASLIGGNRSVKSRLTNENAALLQMNLNDVIKKLNYRNIYRVNTNPTQTIDRFIDIPSGPIFETTALAQTKQTSVQTSRSDILKSKTPIYLGPSRDPADLSIRVFEPRVLSSRKTRILSGNISEDVVEHTQMESVIHQVELDTSYMAKKKNGARRIQIEKNVVSYVINPRKKRYRKEQAESKCFVSAVQGGSRTGTAKAIKSTSFNNLKPVNYNVESKCEMVYSWPPKRPQPVYGTARKGFFVSVHVSDGEDRQQKQDNLPIKLSADGSNNSQRSNARVSQKQSGTQIKTERVRRTRKQPMPSCANKNYVIGHVASVDGEGEKMVPKCNNHHRYRKEKLKRKKLKRIPEVIDVTVSKQVKRSMLEYRAINDDNVPGFVTILSTPCDCPDVTIFIPCFCGNYKCDKCKVSRFTKNKKANYTMIPLTNQTSGYSV